MPYTILLRTANLEATEHEDAWGNRVYAERPLGEPEKAKVRALLLSRGGRRVSGIDDRVELNLTDGSLVQVHLIGLYTGRPCLRGELIAAELSMPLLQFAIDLAHLGPWMLTPENYSRPIVATEPLRQKLMMPIPHIQSAYSAAMLWNMLVPRQDANELPVDEATDSTLP